MKGLLALLLFATIMAGSALAEITVYGSNVLDADEQVWIQNVLVNYPEWETEILSLVPVVRHKVSLACEDLSVWNSNNPNNQIRNATLFYTHFDYVANSTAAGSPLIGIYTDGELIVDVQNEPNWFIQFIWDLFGITQQPEYNKELRFAIEKGEYISYRLVTYFNQSNGTVEDSHCMFSVSFESLNCDGCRIADVNYEEAIGEVEQLQDNFDNAISPAYSVMSGVINMNFQLWVIMAWVAKIAIFLGAIAAFFYSLFWVYLFFRKIVRGED